MNREVCRRAPSVGRPPDEGNLTAGPVWPCRTRCTGGMRCRHGGGGMTRPLWERSDRASGGLPAMAVHAAAYRCSTSDPHERMDARMCDDTPPAIGARRARIVLTAGLFCLAPLAWSAPTGDDAAALAKGAQPDATAEQRYQSAVREAGGALKASLAECQGLPDGAQREGCRNEARKRHQEDMSEARALMHPPGTRNPVGPSGPNKEVETRIVGKPPPGS